MDCNCIKIFTGLPILVRNFSQSSAHIHSNLQAVNCDIRLFTTIEEEYQNTGCGSIVVIRQSHSLMYGSEATVASWVVNYLEDVVQLAGLTGTVHICPEQQIAGLRPDAWLLLQHGIPIGVVEVKKPATGILKNDLVISQLRDYMLLLKEYYGLRHIFGILTTFNEWRVCWLPSSDTAASSDHLVDTVDVADE